MDQQTAELWAIAVGIVLPLGISAILRQGWGESQKAWGAFVFCLISSAGTCYFTGVLNFDSKQIAFSTLTIFITAWTTYRNFYKPTGVSAVIDKATG